MTVAGTRFQVTAPYCSKGCGRLRRKSGRYCAECHRIWQRRRRTQQMTEPQIFAKAIRKCDLMLSRIARGKHPLTGV